MQITNLSKFKPPDALKNSALFVLQVTLPELTGPNYSVITVNATDKDDGDNAEITYTMLPVMGFTMDSRTGELLILN